jgi:multiple sugar transport system permease protein
MGWFRTLRGRRTLIGYIFISPFILGVLLWVLIPALTALWLVFHDWNLISPASYSGLDNILRLGGDKLFWQALKVTTIYTFSQCR